MASPIRGQTTANAGIFYEITPGTTWTETGTYTFPAAARDKNPIDYGSLFEIRAVIFTGRPMSEALTPGVGL